jgi:hypothetical protein
MPTLVASVEKPTDQPKKRSRPASASMCLRQFY